MSHQGNRNAMSHRNRRNAKEENLDNFGKMITNCGNEQGAHFLYNGPCDVIGRQVLSIITAELDISLGYFEIFENALRPIHCAILLRNVTILKALTEKNMQYEAIKRACDFRNEKNFQKELHSKVTSW